MFHVSTWDRTKCPLYRGYYNFSEVSLHKPKWMCLSLSLNKSIFCKWILTLNKGEPLRPARSPRQVFGYQFFKFGGGGVQGWVMESCCHDLCLHVALPVVGERRDHLSRELTTQVTVEDLRESKHCKYVTGEEVKEERRDRRRRGKRRNINQYGHTANTWLERTERLKWRRRRRKMRQREEEKSTDIHYARTQLHKCPKGWQVKSNKISRLTSGKDQNIICPSF